MYKSMCVVAVFKVKRLICHGLLRAVWSVCVPPPPIDSAVVVVYKPGQAGQISYCELESEAEAKSNPFHTSPVLKTTPGSGVCDLSQI